MFTVMSFHAIPINSLAVPSPSLREYQYNELDMRNFCKQNCFYTIMFYFIWLNLLSVGIVDIFFQSAGTGKYATPSMHLNFHFGPLAVSYELFSQSNQTFKNNWISSRLNLRNSIHQVLFAKKTKHMSYFQKRAAKWPLCGLFRGSLNVLHYTVHMTPLCVL